MLGPLSPRDFLCPSALVAALRDALHTISAWDQRAPAAGLSQSSFSVKVSRLSQEGHDLKNRCWGVFVDPRDGLFRRGHNVSRNVLCEGRKILPDLPRHRVPIQPTQRRQGSRREILHVRQGAHPVGKVRGATVPKSVVPKNCGSCRAGGLGDSWLLSRVT